jgi:hypothetical protein
MEYTIDIFLDDYNFQESFYADTIDEALECFVEILDSYEICPYSVVWDRQLEQEGFTLFQYHSYITEVTFESDVNAFEVRQA